MDWRRFPQKIRRLGRKPLRSPTARAGRASYSSLFWQRSPLAKRPRALPVPSLHTSRCGEAERNFSSPLWGEDASEPFMAKRVGGGDPTVFVEVSAPLTLSAMRLPQSFARARSRHKALSQE